MIDIDDEVGPFSPKEGRALKNKLESKVSFVLSKVRIPNWITDLLSYFIYQYCIREKWIIVILFHRQNKNMKWTYFPFSIEFQLTRHSKVVPTLFTLIYAPFEFRAINSRASNFRAPLFYCKFAVLSFIRGICFSPLNFRAFVLRELAPFNFRAG